MENRNSSLTSNDVAMATTMAGYRVKDVLRRYEDYTNDPRKIERIAVPECIVCFYGSIVAGQAMTEYNCALCDKQLLHSNTATPKLCKECAIENELCIHCGADRELRAGRRKYGEKLVANQQAHNERVNQTHVRQAGVFLLPKKGS